MIKDERLNYYKMIGEKLRQHRKSANLSVSELAKKVGEQFNTIESIEKGRPFMAHHALWMKEVFNIDLSIRDENYVKGQENTGKNTRSKTTKEDSSIGHTSGASFF